jgi:hypothetical protein
MHQPRPAVVVAQQWHGVVLPAGRGAALVTARRNALLTISLFEILPRIFNFALA